MLGLVPPLGGSARQLNASLVSSGLLAENRTMDSIQKTISDEDKRCNKMIRKLSSAGKVTLYVFGPCM